MEHSKQPKRRNEGFTLVELIVVITIMGILATVVLVNIGSASDEANVAKVNADFGAIGQACDIFKLHHNRYPESIEELMSPPARPNGMTSEPYLKSTPKDPWRGEMYFFELDDRGPLLISYGADRAEGGEGFNADISNRDDSP